MQKVVDFNEAEVCEPDDLTAIGTYARGGDQDIVGGAIAYPHHHARFAVSQPSAVLVRLNAGGLYFADNTIYSLDDNYDVNLQAYLPVVNGDLKWVALLVRGTTQTDNANRMVETDADTGATVSQAVPKTGRLMVTIVVQDGTSSPTPIKPSIASNDCNLMFVQLNVNGIVTTEAGETWRLKTLFEINGRVTLLEGEMGDVVQRTTNLETNIATIMGRLKDIPRQEVMFQLQRDAAAVRKQLTLPDTARAYWYDPGLLMDDWDATHADWLGRLNEGMRFAFAQIVDAQLAILNPGDPLLRTTDTYVLPAWTETTRISVEGQDGYKDISQQVHTVTTAVQNSVSGVNINYGPTINVCDNQAEWAAVANTHVGQTFVGANGNTYISDGLSTGPGLYMDPGGAIQSTTYDYGAWNANPASLNGHQAFQVQQVDYQSWSYTYWSYYTTSYGVNGSVYSQSFLNGQQLIATSVDLYFTRVGTDGDVHLFLSECDATGAPQFVNVLASCTVSFASLALGWVKFAFDPTLLEAGKRYAWYTVTVGNHAIATVNANKFAQGSLFWCTDGAWSQGDPTTDFAFHLNAASFANLRTTIDFASLVCPSGMTQIQLLYNGWAPAGTSFIWEIKPVGATDWTPLQPSVPDASTNPLVGLPALTQLRATFLGTTDLQPAIKMDNAARGMAMRMRSDATWVSKVQSFGFSTTAITLTTVVDNFDVAHNTFTNKIEIGSTIYTPSATTTVIDPDRPLRRTITSTFTVPSTTSARAHPVATTDNVVKVPFIQNIMMIAS